MLHTNSPGDSLNGILFTVRAEEIPDLAEREYGYDAVAVDCSGGQGDSRAYIFSASKSSSQIGHRVAEEVLPNESALTTCLAGAATYGREFLEGWIDSCYLADETPLANDPFCAALIEQFLSSAKLSF